MQLQGSCHCRRVRFRLQAYAPVPYQYCYCSICRKTAGGGYAVNLGGWADTLEVDGRQHLGIYHATLEDGAGGCRQSSGQRHFCRHCGSALWLYDPTWPDLVHPHASAIDTPLPEAPERYHIMLGSKAEWVGVPSGPRDRHFTTYPDESLQEWHRRHGLYEPRT